MCAHVDYKNLLTSLLGPIIYPIDPYQKSKEESSKWIEGKKGLRIAGLCTPKPSTHEIYLNEKDDIMLAYRTYMRIWLLECLSI